MKKIASKISNDTAGIIHGCLQYRVPVRINSNNSFTGKNRVVQQVSTYSKTTMCYNTGVNSAHLMVIFVEAISSLS